MAIKTSIDERYFPEEEIRKNITPYEDYYECLSETFNFDDIDSFCDLGCANGPLIYIVKRENPGIEVIGLEYFEWQKESSDDSIRDSIVIHDLRDEWIGDKKYQIVNCTETGEHIDPDFMDVFLDTVKKMSSRYLIISWADSGGKNDPINDEHQQHLNPLPSHEVERILTERGFVKNDYLTSKFLSLSNSKNNFYYWWRKSLGIWEIPV